MEEYITPEWCKDSVLTDVGVANKFTAELYLSKRGVGEISYDVLKRDVALLRSLGKYGQLPNCCKPVAEKPVAEKPVAEKPVAEKPVAEKPVVEKPVAKKPKTTQKKAKQSKKVGNDNEEV